jgi:3-hydroxybutyrate dehydrogenase
MELREPEISRKDILILQDERFNPGNVCIVTGAASGIGRATAVAAAANGLTTVGLDINEEGAKKTQQMVAELGGELSFIKTDLARDEEMERAVEGAAKLGSVKYLANIAGMQHMDSILDFPMETYDLMQRVMIRAPFYLSKLTMHHMKKSSDGTGVIGNMASIHAHICTVNKTAYNIAKFGMRALSQSISAEGEGNIRSFSVSTGTVQTPLLLNQIPIQAKKRGISNKEAVRDVILAKSRVKEMMSPIDVANLFIFGFSRFSKFLIGGDLLFDGGKVLTYF